METLASVKNDQNIAVVQQAFDHFSKGNISGILENCTDDIQWGSYDNPDVPYASVYKGKNGVVEFFSNLSGSVDYENFETNKFYGDQDMVFVLGNHKGRVKTTGKKFGHDFVMQFRLRDGKVSNFFAWVDSRDQAQAFNTATGAKTAAVKELYSKFFEGNIPGILDQLTDDVSWDATANIFIEDPRVFKGKQEVLEFFKYVAAAVRIPVFQPLNFYENGDTLFVNGHFEVETISDNQPVSLDWTMRWKFRGDKISDFAEYMAKL